MRGPSLFTQRNLARALRAVKAAGVNANVVVGKDGAFSIILTDPAPVEAANDKAGWDKVLGVPKVRAQKRRRCGSCIAIMTATAS
jgi:hypothetical protein